MKIIGFFGGPGCGKSTVAASTFAELKRANYNVELVTEYAKQLTWEDRGQALSNQVYVFAKQLHMIHRLKTKVDYIVTDSPLIMSLAYKPEELSYHFDSLVHETFVKYDNINFFVKRMVDYDPNGRNQTREEAEALDKKIMDILNDGGYDYSVITPHDFSVLDYL